MRALFIFIFLSVLLVCKSQALECSFLLGVHDLSAFQAAKSQFIAVEGAPQLTSIDELILKGGVSDVISVSGVLGIRDQCTGNCVYESFHTAIEHRLSSVHYWPEGGYFSGFVNQMKIAWYRHNVLNNPITGITEEDPLDLYTLLDAIDFRHPLESMNKGKGLIYKTGTNENLSYSVLVAFDNYLLQLMNSPDKDNQSRYHQLMSLEFDDFVDEVIKFVMEQSENQSFLVKNGLSFEEQPAIDFDYDFYSRKRSSQSFTLDAVSNEFLTAPYKSGDYWLPEFYEVDDDISLSTLERRIISQVDKGQITLVSLEEYYDNDSLHILALTGYVLDLNGNLIGFELTNSWGQGHGDQGIEYISINDFRVNAVEVFIISSVHNSL